MVSLPRVVTIACAALLLTSCGIFGDSTEGDAETDRQSATLAEAISYPRQENAMGFARAALGTQLGKDPSFSVLVAEDLEHEDLQEPMARLVWRIHRSASDSGWTKTPAFDACYLVEFNYYEAITGPSRTTCPAGATAIAPPPLPKRTIPQNSAPALETTLGALPATPGEAEVRAALAAGLPAPPVDRDTNIAGILPQVFVAVGGSDVGVALYARVDVEDKDCMMGQRVGGAVKVWSLNWRDLGPQEKPCSAQAALSTRW
ncbi:MAG: hypothetical protein ABIQ18_20945 [Umezawaea sp.]